MAEFTVSTYCTSPVFWLERERPICRQIPDHNKKTRRRRSEPRYILLPCLSPPPSHSFSPLLWLSFWLAYSVFLTKTCIICLIICVSLQKQPTAKRREREKKRKTLQVNFFNLLVGVFVFSYSLARDRSGNYLLHPIMSTKRFSFPPFPSTTCQFPRTN